MSQCRGESNGELTQGRQSPGPMDRRNPPVGHRPRTGPRTRPVLPAGDRHAPLPGRGRARPRRESVGRGPGHLQPQLYPIRQTRRTRLAGRVRPRLVTSTRIVGRLGDDRLHGYRWDKTVGARIDLTPSRETVILDVDGEPTLAWTGPGVAPMAVAAVFHLYGARAMIDHPGLVALRDSVDPARPSEP